MKIDDNEILKRLISISGDQNAKALSKIATGDRLEITLYWNQFGEKYALQKSISRGMLSKYSGALEYFISDIFKEVEYEVGRINYEN